MGIEAFIHSVEVESPPPAKWPGGHQTALKVIGFHRDSCMYMMLSSPEIKLPSD